VKPAAASIDGDLIFAERCEALGIIPAQLVAACSVWVDPALFKKLREQQPDGCWFPNRQRRRNGEPDVVNGERRDDNTAANLAIKLAISGRSTDFRRMTTCHIWPGTCYQPENHTCLANLVLLPSALASLTDFDSEVAGCLQYRSRELYEWWPKMEAPPSKPARYPAAEMWRAIPAAPASALACLRRRRLTTRV
jgi:hypothetical protein